MMNRWAMGGLLLAGTLAGPVEAEVVSTSPHGFETSSRAQATVPPEVVYAAIGRVGQWWSAQHSHSGESANLSLQLAPGGCFCERLANGGGIEHLRVSYVEPGKRVVLTGALGPLLFEAVSGVMDITIEPVAGGSRLTLGYRASGFARGGADRLAPAVDMMLADQLRRLRAYAVASNRRTRAP